MTQIDSEKQRLIEEILGRFEEGKEKAESLQNAAAFLCVCMLSVTAEERKNCMECLQEAVKKMDRMESNIVQ